MNLQTITRAVKFTSLILFILITCTSFARADWAIDFSRRTKDLKSGEHVVPGNQKENQSLFEYVFDRGVPTHEMVVLNTKHGFVPATVRVKQGLRYKIHVVNVNDEHKNISFVLDSFSEHHATYYGKIKTFFIEPKKEGVYSFQCPETSAQGRLVVYKNKEPMPDAVDVRQPSSE